MTFPLILFYLFSSILIASSLVVVSSRNTIYSVLFLILAFFNASALFVLVGAEYLAMLLIIVYVGAIAVLFLFVVMMLNVDKEKIVEGINTKLPLLILIAVVIFLEIIAIIKASETEIYKTKTLFPIADNVTNVGAIGKVLYTDFFLPFQIAGAILLVAMIGAIVLTIKDQSTRFIRKQVIFDQLSHNKKNSIEIVKVESGKGINI